MSAEPVNVTCTSTHWPWHDVRWGWRLGSPGSQRAILRLVCTFVPHASPHPPGIYLLVVTATSPPCPSVDPAAPSTARSGSSPRDPTSQLCEGWSLQRCLPHLHLLLPLLTHPAGPKTPFFSPLLPPRGPESRHVPQKQGKGQKDKSVGVG